MTAETVDNLTVLVVDDNEAMRLLMRKMLSGLEIDVVRTAKTGGEALELIATQDPDLIIADHQMTPMNGVEFVRQIRASTNARVRGLPVIMMTAFTDTTLLNDAVKAGVDDFLAKPISPDTLKERIHRLHPRLSRQRADAVDQGKPVAPLAGSVVDAEKAPSTGRPTAA